MATKFRVTYIERERGWGQDVYTVDYDSLEVAIAARDACNAKNNLPTVPDIYTVADQKIEAVLV